MTCQLIRHSLHQAIQVVRHCTVSPRFLIIIQLNYLYNPVIATKLIYLLLTFHLLIIPQFCLPLLMEKLSSDIIDAKIDSLLTLVSHCSQTSIKRASVKRSPSIKRSLIKFPKIALHNYCKRDLY